MNERLNTFYETTLGRAYSCDSLALLRQLPDASIDLVLTSPPFALTKKKSYGNVSATSYWSWFEPFALEIWRVLKPRGSLVLEIGGSWKPGFPVRSLYNVEVLLNLTERSGLFYLAQEFFWHNPAKMPAPAQWVTIERIRVKDSVTPIWWLSKSMRPKASNRRVLRPYSKSMQNLLKNGYNKGKRPSGHDVSNKWGNKHKGSIPDNIIIASNTRSTDRYLDACRALNLQIHPARFVREVPEFFVKFATVRGDTVLDPFAGSNIVGEVCESLGREWISAEINSEYVYGSSFRFEGVGELVYALYQAGDAEHLLSLSSERESQ
ncbi:MAG: site-specific DNA-methyltransferase [candidate division Zixibacteria bacterium]|nr:site-specific DNA-methyltransferase [candidate division Zixibacteria bacterium]